MRGKNWNSWSASRKKKARELLMTDSFHPRATGGHAAVINRLIELTKALEKRLSSGSVASKDGPLERQRSRENAETPEVPLLMKIQRVSEFYKRRSRRVFLLNVARYYFNSLILSH